jgi:acyl-CoA dehydrogenase
MSLLEKHYTQEHQIFRESIRRYFEKEVTPHVETWEKAGIVPKEIWQNFGRQGFLCPWLPEIYGGVDADLLYSLISVEESAKTHFSGFLFFLHSDIIVPYIEAFGSEEQKHRWLPGCATGDIITAIAMTEPGTGSDLAAIRTTAVRNGDHYVLNGQKTFISNGINCDLVIVVAKTDPGAKPAHAGISLLVVEDGTPGFEKGRNLDKIGFHSQDTAEMAFVDCRVPVKNLLGQEGKGFYYLMKKLQQERLMTAIGAQVMAEEALRLTIDFAKSREAFGRPIGRFQRTGQTGD